MDLAELGHHRLRAQLQARRAARVPPGRGRALRRLQRSDGRAQFLEQGQQVGLDGEDVALRGLVPAARGLRDQDRRDDGALVGRLVAVEGRADLEQGRVREALAGVAAGRLDQVGQQRRAHAVQLRGDRIGQHQLGLTAAEQFGGLAAGEAEAHGLGVAGGRQGAARRAGASLLGGQDPAHGARNLRQRRRGQGAIAGDAGDFLDQVGLAFHVAAEGGRGDGPGRAVRHVEAQGDQDLARAIG